MMKALIVRGASRWTEAKKELKEELQKTVGWISNEKQLKEEVQEYLSKEEFARLFAVEDTISDAVARQVKRFLFDNILYRVCVLDALGSEIINFKPNWIVTIGDNLLYIKVAHLVFYRTPVFGINLDTTGSEGYLCVGGKFPPPSVSVRKLSRSHLARPRIAMKIEFPEGKTPNGAMTRYLVLNEIFFGNEDANKAFKMRLSYPDYRQSPDLFVLQEMQIFTGSGYIFKQENSRQKMKSTSNALDVYSSLDEETGSRMTDSQIIDHPMSEGCLNFAIFMKEFDAKKNTMMSSKSLENLDLKVKQDGVFMVLDGIKKIELPKQTKLELKMHDFNSLITFSN